jgi:hypothetical protein
VDVGGDGFGGDAHVGKGEVVGDDAAPAVGAEFDLRMRHGAWRWGASSSTSRDDTRFQRDMLVKVSRKVIASAQGDQLAADSGPLPNHSLFTGLMIQGLTSGKADSYGEGFVTSSQLGAYAQHEVAVAAGSKQTPLFGAFDDDQGGELVIHMGAGAQPAAADASKPG